MSVPDHDERDRLCAGAQTKSRWTRLVRVFLYEVSGSLRKAPALCPSPPYHQASYVFRYVPCQPSERLKATTSIGYPVHRSACRPRPLLLSSPGRSRPTPPELPKVAEDKMDGIVSWPNRAD
jgi:hypothetical protein